MTFEQLQEELHKMMRAAHDAGDVKLLNVGTDHSREHHWRFRTPSGEIVTISIAKE